MEEKKTGGLKYLGGLGTPYSIIYHTIFYVDFLVFCNIEHICWPEKSEEFMIYNYICCTDYTQKQQMNLIKLLEDLMIF